MNQIKRLLTLTIITLMASLLIHADDRDWAGINRYAEANAKLPAPAKGQHRVVFLGNSITEGWFNTHPNFFNDNNYVGRGISGQTSSQFLGRFREDVIKLNPEVVVINAGTNDCAENTGPFNLEVTFGNIVSMVELARANDIKVILTSVLPAAEFGWNRNVTDAPDRINSLNAKIKAYAESHKIPYVDYYSAMVSDRDGAQNPAYTGDGVHPNAAGYDVMESLIVPAINKTIRRNRKTK